MVVGSKGSNLSQHKNQFSNYSKLHMDMVNSLEDTTEDSAVSKTSPAHGKKTQLEVEEEEKKIKQTDDIAKNTVSYRTVIQLGKCPILHAPRACGRDKYKKVLQFNLFLFFQHLEQPSSRRNNRESALQVLSIPARRSIRYLALALQCPDPA